MAERLREIKEKPIIDERYPHPYREVLAELRTMRELLEEVKERLPAVVPPPPAMPTAPPAPPIVVPRPIGVVEISTESIEKLAKLVAELTTSRLERLPNRLEKVEIDTSKKTQISLRKQGRIKPKWALGFWVEAIGGGFDYVIVRDGFGKDAKTAEADDKWDQEFDDLLITGSGTAGTARLWYWWIEPEKVT